MYIEYELLSPGRYIVNSVKNDDTLEINYNRKNNQFAIPGVIFFIQSAKHVILGYHLKQFVVNK